MYNKNAVYTAVANTLRADTRFNQSDGSACFCTAERNNAPSAFPCAWIVEIDAYPENRYIDLALTADTKRSTFEVQCFSNLASGATSQTYNMIEAATEAFRQLGYIRTMSEPMQNTMRPEIKRHIARFSRTFGDDDTLPTIT